MLTNLGVVGTTFHSTKRSPPYLLRFVRPRRRSVSKMAAVRLAHRAKRERRQRRSSAASCVRLPGVAACCSEEPKRGRNRLQKEGEPRHTIGFSVPWLKLTVVDILLELALALEFLRRLALIYSQPTIDDRELSTVRRTRPPESDNGWRASQNLRQLRILSHLKSLNYVRARARENVHWCARI